MKKINIAIPIGGLGSRFTNAGFEIPKPLININGKPMIQVVCENLLSKKYKINFILIFQRKFLEKYDILSVLNKIKGANVKIIQIDKMTDGQLSTIMLASEYINNDDYLLCANCDQYIDINIDDFFDYAIFNKLDGLIMTMPSDGSSKWSYSKIASDGYVLQTAEKEVISDEATTGLYFFSKGKYLFEAGNNLKKNNIRTNGEFYICPCYNYLIKDKKKIMNYNIFSAMYGLGTPADLCNFLSLDISRKV